MYRDSCPRCAIKHLTEAWLLRGRLVQICRKLAQGHILRTESRLGYTEHYWLALGHLAEAEDELLAFDPDLAGQVREERKKWEECPTYWVEFTSLIDRVVGSALLSPDFSEWLQPGALPGLASKEGIRDHGDGSDGGQEAGAQGVG